MLLGDYQKLGNLILYNESEKFGDSMTNISMLCIEFDRLWSDYDSNRMSESEFYSLIKSYSSEFLEDQLIYHSFKFLLFILGFTVLLLSNIFEIKI